METILTWSNVYVKQYQKQTLADRFWKSRSEKDPIILNDVSGIARPGEVLAIMGTSGVGKTTLLNFLSGQEDFHSIESKGDVYLNGHIATANHRRNRSIIGHVQQYESFFELMTVEEHLIFEAMLIMHMSVKDEDRRARVRDVLRTLFLEKCSQTIISRLSGGELKRLAFAAVLLCDPQIVLIDEPTSGLDLYMAKTLMNIIREIAVDKRRTVIIVLHQPTEKMFASIDSLCLLVHGGRQAFFGSREKASMFFQSECNLAGASLDNYIEQLAPVSDSMEKTLNQEFRAADRFLKSEHAYKLENSILSLYQEPLNKLIPTETEEWRSGFSRQMKWVLWRSWIIFQRNPKLTTYLAIRLVLIGMLYGVLLFQIKPTVKDYAHNINALTLYMSLILIESNVSGLMFAIVSERGSIVRDYKRRMYFPSVYYIIRFVIDAALGILSSIIYTSIITLFVGLHRPFLVILVSTLNMLAAISTAPLIAALVDTPRMALVLYFPIYLSFAQFSGYFINSNSLPSYIRWFKYLCFYYYYYCLMLMSQWYGVSCVHLSSSISSTDDSNHVCKYTGLDILDYYGANPKHFTRDICALIAIIVISYILAFILAVVRIRRAA